MNYEPLGLFEKMPDIDAKIKQDIQRRRQREKREKTVTVSETWLKTLPIQAAVAIQRDPEMKRLKKEIARLEKKEAESGLTENESIKLDSLKAKYYTRGEKIKRETYIPKTRTGKTPEIVYVETGFKPVSTNDIDEKNGDMLDMSFITSEIGRLQDKQQAIGLTASEQEYLEMLYQLAGITPPTTNGTPSIPGGGIPGGDGGAVIDTTSDIPLEAKKGGGGGLLAALAAGAAAFFLLNQ